MVHTSPVKFTHYAKLYPQNDDRIVTIDFMTSFHPVYSAAELVEGRLRNASRIDVALIDERPRCSHFRLEMKWPQVAA